MIIAVSLLAGLFVSTVVTTVGWKIQIEGRAFQCDDWIPFSTFATDMTNHREAGDIISSGWTWEGIERVGRVYRTAFFFLWAVVTGLCSIVWIKKRNQNQASEAINAEAAPQR
ncbi:MAG: hypothetical protein Q7J98_14490 [Kiritimatiellia bacterium]|nr:hypothetical protein [Kiritimatiellia bacterium]